VDMGRKSQSHYVSMLRSVCLQSSACRVLNRFGGSCRPVASAGLLESVLIPIVIVTGGFYIREEVSLRFGRHVIRA